MLSNWRAKEKQRDSLSFRRLTAQTRPQTCFCLDAQSYAAVAWVATDQFCRDTFARLTLSIIHEQNEQNGVIVGY